MATKLTRRVPDIFRHAQTYLHERVRNLEYTRSFESAKKPVKDWLKKYGTEDTAGNLVYQFPTVLAGADGKFYSGVMLKRSVGPAYFNDDEVMKLIDSLDADICWEERVWKTVRVLDQDQLYLMHQEGVITEDQLRGLLHYPNPTYALWPVEAKEIFEDEEE
jgi:hypothetical protein